jgi:O-antigen ligase
MRQYFSLTTYNKTTIALIVAIIVGLAASRALVSIATALLAVNIILHIGLLNVFENCKKYFYALMLFLLPLSVLVLLPFSPNYAQGFQLLAHKIPFLVIPISVVLIDKEFLQQHLYKLLGVFILVIFVSGVFVGTNYLLNFEHYNKLLTEGRAIPTPHEHIRYSLMLSFACLVSIFLAWQKKGILFLNDRRVLIFTSIFFFILIHILSVRIGLITLYAGLLLLILYYISRSKKHFLSVLVLFVFIAAPVISYYTLPSFKNRVNYMLYDFQQLENGTIGHNSDSRRIISLKLGVKLFKENTLIGVGVGNIQNKVNETYQELYPTFEEHNRKLPHNQFLYTLVELGIIGGILLLMAFFVPLFFTNFYTLPLYYILACMVFLSMLVDNTLESQIGITFYALFSTLFLKIKTEK